MTLSARVSEQRATTLTWDISTWPDAVCSFGKTTVEIRVEGKNCIETPPFWPSCRKEGIVSVPMKFALPTWTARYCADSSLGRTVNWVTIPTFQVRVTLP